MHSNGGEGGRGCSQYLRVLLWCAFPGEGASLLVFSAECDKHTFLLCAKSG